MQRRMDLGAGGGVTCPTLNRLSAVAAGYVIIDYMNIYYRLSLISRPGNLPYFGDFFFREILEAHFIVILPSSSKP